MTSLAVPTAVLSRARRVANDFRALTGVECDADAIIAGRAGLLRQTPHDRISAGGATHLMRSRDGWCALTLSRPDDVDAVPALIEVDTVAGDPWPDVHRWVSERHAAEFTDRGRLLGLPVAALGESRARPPRRRALGAATSGRAPSGLLVADLSAMWAGPLCGQLLARAGATVVKVESASRPDGARSGPAEFFDWMNGGKLSYLVDFDDPSGLRSLLAAADVVIESSRPAAFARRGLAPEDVQPRDGRVWLRITGHGTDGERGNWVAFGDDAAVSGGLVRGSAAEPDFCGDAIADPLTGLEAAATVAQALRDGGGQLVELSMSAVAATYARLPRTDEISCSAAPPPSKRASALGADNAAVERTVAEKLLAAC
ncbi:CoA transferase [Mycolicibacterium rhodesiae]|uniref:CoA transferase n=1 Tax=Mycolicibacterium rhodesiae TaxID=36814 RepID=UPI000303984F|nr:CoA transferase [Mycolicibacterium rhodesiae]